MANKKLSQSQIAANQAKTRQRRADIKAGKITAPGAKPINEKNALKEITGTSLGQIQEQTPFSLSGLNNDMNNFNFDQQRQALEDRAYQRFADVNEPRFQKEQGDFEQRMAQRGIAPGSELYTAMQQDLSRNQEDARGAARAQALNFGGQETERAFNLGSKARSQSVDEYGMARGAPWSELAGALSARSSLKDINAPIQKPGYYGPPQQDPAALANADYENWKRKQDYMANNQPKGPTTGSSIAGAIVPGIASGVGKGIGGFIGGLFK